MFRGTPCTSTNLSQSGTYYTENEKTTVNPIPAGELENQDTLGGGQFDPTPL